MPKIPRSSSKIAASGYSKAYPYAPAPAVLDSIPSATEIKRTEAQPYLALVPVMRPPQHLQAIRKNFDLYQNDMISATGVLPRTPEANEMENPTDPLRGVCLVHAHELDNSANEHSESYSIVRPFDYAFMPVGGHVLSMASEPDSRCPSRSGGLAPASNPGHPIKTILKDTKGLSDKEYQEIFGYGWKGGLEQGRRMGYDDGYESGEGAGYDKAWNEIADACAKQGLLFPEMEYDHEGCYIST